MKANRLPVLLLIAGALVIAFVVLRFVQPTDTPNPTGGGTYIEGIAGAPRAINPLLCELNDADRDLCGLIFSGLTRLNEFGEAQPDLAETWIASPDGLTYTVKIRDTARWHDGIMVDAEDVVFTAQLLQAPDFPGRADIGALWQTIKVAKIDDQTVRFVLSQPIASFPDFLSIGLLPRHVLSTTNAANIDKVPFNLQPIGTGGWKLTNVASAGTRVSAITLEPVSRDNVTHKPFLDKIILRYYTSPQAVFEAFRIGEIDGTGGLTPDLMNRLIGRDDLTIHTTELARSVSVFINTRKDSGTVALSEKPVRQALMYALDRDRLVREALAGQAVVADSLFIPDTWAYHTGVKKYTTNALRAVELLRGAGYELRAVAPSPREVWQKDGEALSFTLLTPDDPVRRAVAEAVATQWRELGVVVAVQPVRNLARDFLATRQFQAALTDLEMGGDPEVYALWHRSQTVTGQNYAGYESKEVSDWVEQARLSQDRTVRAELYRKLQDALADDLPAIPLYHPIYRYVIANYVRNVQLPPLLNTSDRLRNVSDWAISTRAPRR